MTNKIIGIMLFILMNMVCIMQSYDLTIMLYLLVCFYSGMLYSESYIIKNNKQED